MLDLCCKPVSDIGERERENHNCVPASQCRSRMGLKALIWIGTSKLQLFPEIPYTYKSSCTSRGKITVVTKVKEYIQ